MKSSKITKQKIKDKDCIGCYSLREISLHKSLSWLVRINKYYKFPQALKPEPVGKLRDKRILK